MHTWLKTVGKTFVVIAPTAFAAETFPAQVQEGSPSDVRILSPMELYFHRDGIIWGLQQIGCEVRTLSGTPNTRAEIARAVEEFHPDVVFTYGWWTDCLNPEDLAWVCKQYHLPHVYWASDDPTHHEQISLPFAHLADMVFTTTEELLPVYQRMGKKASCLQFACNPNLHHPQSAGSAKRYDIVLIANNYSHHDFMSSTYRTRALETIVRPLVEAGFDLMVYGDGWADIQRPFHIPPAFAGPDVIYQNLAHYYGAAKIVLGMQTECHWRTQSSCRPFEVMGCRAFFLSPDSASMRRLFTHGRHMVISRSAMETVALALYYLEHEVERERIAAAGQLEVYEKHTYIHRAREFLARVAEII